MTDTPDDLDPPTAAAHGMALLQRALQTELPAGRGAALHQRLLSRVTDSARRHSGYHTVRREQGSWQLSAPGVRCRPLRASGGLRAELVQLQDGAWLPAAADTQAQEVLVVQGGLHGRTSADATVLGPLSYLVRQAGQATGSLQASAPTTLFVRSWLSGSNLPPLEASWWQMACRKPLQLAAGRRPWTPAGPGLQVQALCGDRQVVSMLVRFEPGAGVPDHDHAIDEDCLMLAGEMFLGDVLLRPMDYQMAPAGLGHFGETSERGGLFYFHGALDDVLLPR
jgi:hypothetical protein